MKNHYYYNAENPHIQDKHSLPLWQQVQSLCNNYLLNFAHMPHLSAFSIMPSHRHLPKIYKRNPKKDLNWHSLPTFPFGFQGEADKLRKYIQNHFLINSVPWQPLSWKQFCVPFGKFLFLPKEKTFERFLLPKIPV